jgi:hypothetical protein
MKLMFEPFEWVIAEALEHPDGCVEILAPSPDHFWEKYRWRVRIPGRGVFMGRVDGYDTEKDETAGNCLVFDWADTFVPENEADQLT